jgi:outer membrane protein OmpA-like peptidoglycan-associated protein
MGKPINSNMDDFSLVFEENSNNGYMASNRAGGVGDDDIYRIVSKPVNCLEYSGFVLDSKTKEPIPNADVELYDYSENQIIILKTDALGAYLITLPCNKENKLVFSKPEFSKKIVIVKTEENPISPSTDNIVLLTPYERLVEKDGDVEKIKVDPIYFDYAKYNITTRAEIELEKVLFAMREFPTIKIKIESHTDSRGSDDYNLQLSDDRAKSTRRYLISKGIDVDRIESANGFGEIKLKNKCKNGVKCSEQEHLLNRRSDFIIIDM